MAKKLKTTIARDCWSLDHSLAKWLLPRLVHFRVASVGHTPMCLSAPEWADIIEAMIRGFAIAADPDKVGCGATTDDEDARVRYAFGLLAAHYGHMWT